MTGVEFYTRCGALMVGSQTFVDRAAQGKTAVKVFDNGLRTRFPYLAPYPTAFATLDVDAGHVDPYKMVEAQNVRAVALGARVVEDGTVARLQVVEGGRGVVAHLEDGSSHEADVAVVAGGAYTKHLLSVSGIGFGDAGIVGCSLEEVRISRRTVLLAEVSEEDALVSMSGMPTVKWLHVRQAPGEAPESHGATEASSVYILPPISYPEYGGRWFVKIGGGPNDFMEDDGNDKTALENFYAGPGDTALAAKLEDILHDVFPATTFLSITSKPCVTTCSPDGVYKLVPLAGGRVLAATGCQGKAAMCADALGREVAQLVLGGTSVQ